MRLPQLFFLTALFSTFFCTAVNCYTYRLAYPLWLKVRTEEFAALHREYLRQLTPVITIPHVLMFFRAQPCCSYGPTSSLSPTPSRSSHSTRPSSS